MAQFLLNSENQMKYSNCRIDKWQQNHQKNEYIANTIVLNIKEMLSNKFTYAVDCEPAARLISFASTAIATNTTKRCVRIAHIIRIIRHSNLLKKPEMCTDIMNIRAYKYGRGLNNTGQRAGPLHGQIVNVYVKTARIWVCCIERVSNNNGSPI